MSAFTDLQAKLKEIFQLDRPDLDFGIYRIMNIKKAEILSFIEKDLPAQIKEYLKDYSSQDTQSLRQELEKTVKSLQDAGVDPDNAPKVKELKAKIAQAGASDGLEQQIYSDLYNFFKRYYSEGDFLSLRRYKEGVYALPYEGEEVKLHWANADQYYIKSSENFTNYTFKAGNSKIRFEVIQANTEQNNNKDNQNRNFRLIADHPVRIENGEYIISFSYLPDPSKTKQEVINKEIETAILSNSVMAPVLADLSAKQTADKNSVSLLLKHLNTFTGKNQFDYFIHKDLGKFLRRELDFYIKNEIMHLDDIENDSTPKVEQYLSKIKCLRKIAGKIITFLASLEDFQKKLWLKKKFILETNYCITLDKIPQTFYAEIAQNEAQRKEWVKLFAIDEIKPDIARHGYSEPLTEDFLKENPFLVLDTAFFSNAFKYKLLSHLNDIDQETDGLLIHSENFQALNLLQERYKESVQCIYIDPPFNTGNDFFYKDNYQTSSWVSLIYDRIKISTQFLDKKGNYFLHLDENANHLGKMILQSIYGEGIIKEIIYNTNATKDEENDLFGYKSFGNNFVLKHQTIFHVSFADSYFNKLWKPNRNETMLNIGWLDLISENKIFNAKSIDDMSFHIETWENGTLQNKYIDITEKIFPISDLWTDIFSFTQSEMRVSESLSFLASQKPENLMRRVIQSTLKPKQTILDFFAGSGTTLAVAHKLCRKWIGIEVGNHFETTYLDDRDFIEKIGLLGRLKYVLFGDQQFKFNGMHRRPHLSKDIGWQGGGLFKYIRLESYEDTLDNLAFKRTQEQEQMFKEHSDIKQEYMLNYMMDLETQDSLLNIQKFNHPFSYEIKITRNDETQTVKVDLAETFNYLVGLKVKHINHYSTVNGSKKQYGILTIEGETRSGEKTLILWRDTSEVPSADLDTWFEKHAFNTKDKEYDTIYINGDNNLENLRKEDETWKVRLIESEFLKKMFDSRTI